MLLACACGGEPAEAPRPAPPPVAEASRPGAEVSVLWRSGASTTVPGSLRAEALALMQSCGDRERREVTEEDWAEARQAGPALEIRFDSAVAVDISGRPGLPVSALLVDFATPARVLARDGDVLYSSFTACDPHRLSALLAAAEKSSGH